MYKDLIRQLDNKLNAERLEIILQQISTLQIPYHKHEYTSGTNVFIDLGTANKRIGISSHFDRVKISPGANDNASAISACIDVIKKFKLHGDNEIGLRVFFFDEEETGLKGSKAYVNKFGTTDLIGLLNMELVGIGNKLAVWPVNSNNNGPLLKIFESVCSKKKIDTIRIDQLLFNTSDHLSFRNSGLTDSFTISCISDGDLKTAEHYMKAIEFDVDEETLYDIYSQAPIFEHYHRPTDTFETIFESSITMTSDAVWDTVLAFNN